MEQSVRPAVGTFGWLHSVSRGTIDHFVLFVIKRTLAILGLLQYASFAGDLQVSKSTSGGVLCIFGDGTFVAISWICKKQPAVSHSTTEAEIVTLDAGLRLEGLPVSIVWECVVDVFSSTKNAGRALHGAQ